MSSWERPGSREVPGRVIAAERVGGDLMVRAEVLEPSSEPEEVRFEMPYRAGIEPDSAGILRWTPRSARDGWRGTGRGSWSFRPALEDGVFHGETPVADPPMDGEQAGVFHRETAPPFPNPPGNETNGNPLES